MFDRTKVWILSLHISISGTLFAYTLAILNNSADNVGETLEWGDLQEEYTTLFSTIVPIGALIGSTFAGSLMSNKGRRLSIMLTDIIMITGSAISVIPFTISFGIGRFLSGVAAGLFLTMSPSFINEITPIEMVPSICPLIQISTDLGLVLAFGVGLPLPASDFSSSSFNSWWVFMFLLPGLIGFYQFCYFWLVHPYDSPLWLLQQGESEKAKQAIARIYHSESAESALKKFEYTHDIEKEAGVVIDSPTYKEIFTDFKYKKMVRIGIALAVIQQFSGINVAVIYSTEIIDDLGQGLFMSRVYTFIMGLVFFISSLLSILLLNNFGRKNLLISGEILLALNYLILGFLVGFQNVSEIVPVILLNVVYIVFAYSLGATLWLYLSEVLIEKVVCISTVTNLFFVCVISGAFPFASEYFGVHYVFLFFSLCMVLASIYTYFDIFETKGKSKRKILKNTFFQ